MPEAPIGPPAPVEASPPAPTPELPATQQVRELISEAGTNALGAEINKTQTALKEKSPEEGKKMIEENPGQKAIATLFLLGDKEWKAPADGLNLVEGGTAKPIKIVKDGKEVIVTEITDATEESFTVTTTDGTEPLKLTRLELTQALAVAERETLLAEMPDNQKEVVKKYLDSLEAEVLGTEDPLTNTSAEELINTQRIAEKALEAQQKEESTETNIYKEANAAYIPGQEAFTLGYYRKVYGDFEEIEKNNLATEQKKLGRELTKEEILLTGMKTVGEYQQRRTTTHQWSGNMESTFQIWKQNHIQSYGIPPTSEQESAYKHGLNFKYANHEDLSIIMDTKIIDEMQRKTSKSDWAAFISFMIAKLGADFAKDFLPTGQ